MKEELCYRLLNEGEKLEPQDEYYWVFRWHTIDPTYAGEFLTMGMAIHRRRIVPGTAVDRRDYHE